MNVTIIFFLWKYKHNKQHSTFSYFKGSNLGHILLVSIMVNSVVKYIHLEVKNHFVVIKAHVLLLWKFSILIFSLLPHN